MRLMNGVLAFAQVLDLPSRAKARGPLFQATSAKRVELKNLFNDGGKQSKQNMHIILDKQQRR